MDSRFYVCSPYTEYKEDALLNRLGRFLGTNITAAVQESLKRGTGPGKKTPEFTLEEMHAIEKLHACNEKLKHVANCPDANSTMRIGGEAGLWGSILRALNLTSSCDVLS